MERPFGFTGGREVEPGAVRVVVRARRERTPPPADPSPSVCDVTRANAPRETPARALHGHRDEFLPRRPTFSRVVRLNLYRAVTALGGKAEGDRCTERGGLCMGRVGAAPGPTRRGGRRSYRRPPRAGRRRSATTCGTYRQRARARAKFATKKPGVSRAFECPRKESNLEPD